MPAIRIRYCRVWNYRPRAARVAAALKDTLSLDSELVEGARGEFTVWVDETCVAKKDEQGFPEEAAVVAAVRRELGEP